MLFIAIKYKLVKKHNYYYITQKLEAAQTIFCISVLGLIRLDHQRNPDIRNKLKVNNIAEDIKFHQNKLLDHLK
jgi:hypothetical protein